jgi:hypothetical protein
MLKGSSRRWAGAREGCGNFVGYFAVSRGRLTSASCASTTGTVFANSRGRGKVDRRPHYPRQDIEARQSLPARPVRSAWVVLMRSRSWECYGLSLRRHPFAFMRHDLARQKIATGADVAAAREAHG